MNGINKIIQDVWGNASIPYELLNGGFVNSTYKIQVNDKYYVLRINGNQNDYLGLSREEENNVIHLAADMGIAPKLLTATPEYLITEFIESNFLSRDDICQPSIIRNTMDILKKVHSIRGINRTFTPFDLLNKHLEGMKTLHLPFPKELNDLLPEVNAIKKRYDNGAVYRKAYCHNDFYPFNILNSNGRLYVIDWELSGEGDIFFDLATISFHEAFSNELDEYMLRYYFGQIENEYYTALRDMKYMNMLREATWGLLHSGMEEATVNHDLNYYEHGINTLKRLHEGFLYL